jgi:hypothetical protein
VDLQEHPDLQEHLELTLYTNELYG